MKAIYANECRFAAGTSHEAVLDEVWNWLAEGRLGVARPDAEPGQSGQLTGLDGASGTWRWTSVDGRSSVAVEMTQPDPAGGGWQTRVWVVDDDGDVRATVQTGPVLAAGLITIANFKGFRPGIVKRWLDRFDVIADGVRLQDTLLRVGPLQAAALVASITNPARRRPIVALTGTAEGGELLADEQFIIRRLGGLAHIVIVEPGASWTLTSELGSDYSVFDGAMRIWWPKFSLDDPAPRHRRWLPWHLTDEDRDCEAELARLVWRVSVDAFGPPALDSALLALERERSVAARVERARDAGGAVSGAWLDDYEATLRELQDRNNDLMLAQAEIANLRAELEEVHSSDATRTPTEDPEATSVEDAVRIAATEAESVVYLASAFESARSSEFPDPDQVLADLRSINRVAAAWAKDALPAGGFRSAFEAEPVRFQPGISATARQRFGGDYANTYADQTVYMGPHLRRGTGAPQRIMRIYWYADETARRFVVGHVGRKLRDDSNQ